MGSMARIPLTPEIIAELKALKEQSGVGETRLFKQSKIIPVGLKVGTVSAWLSGHIKSADRAQLDFVLRLWRATPERTAITRALSQELKTLRRKSGIGPSTLLRGRKDKPPGLTSTKIQGWLNGRAKTALKSDIDYVIKLWVATSPRVALTRKIISKLNAELKRTGHSAHSLHCEFLGDSQQISAALLYAWTLGRIKMVPSDILEMVLEHLRGLPDAANPGVKKTIRYGRIVENRAYLSDKIRRQIRNDLVRTGHSPLSLINRLSPCPDKLTAYVISTWLNSPSLKTALAEHLQFVMDGLACLPDKPVSIKKPRLTHKMKNPRPLSEKDRAALRYERDRSGIGSTALIKRFSSDLPEALTPNKISAMMNGYVDWVEEAHFQWILKNWKTLPGAQ